MITPGLHAELEPLEDASRRRLSALEASVERTGAEGLALLRVKGQRVSYLNLATQFAGGNVQCPAFPEVSARTEPLTASNAFRELARLGRRLARTRQRRSRSTSPWILAAPRCRPATTACGCCRVPASRISS